MAVFALMIFATAGIIKDATGELDEKWFGQQAVYRVSMGSFVRKILRAV
jgi:hypothetical protein